MLQAPGPTARGTALAAARPHKVADLTGSQSQQFPTESHSQTGLLIEYCCRRLGRWQTTRLWPLQVCGRHEIQGALGGRRLGANCGGSGAEQGAVKVAAAAGRRGPGCLFHDPGVLWVHAYKH